MFRLYNRNGGATYFITDTMKIPAKPRQPNHGDGAFRVVKRVGLLFTQEQNHPTLAILSVLLDKG